MLQSGLVSISFRQLSVAQICELAQQCELSGIEWGGDVHVPPGEAELAREAAKLTREHGLQVACYGSYYRAGRGQDFAPILTSALELGAPSIRVWAGEASATSSATQRAETVRDLLAVTAAAAAHDITIATEYHGGTLTDTAESAQQLLSETAGSGLKTLWQPMAFRDESTIEQNLSALRPLLPHLLNVHVYSWTQCDGETVRNPLSAARDEWSRYFAALGGHNGWALLEFVRDDDPANLLDDARTLNQLLNS